MTETQQLLAALSSSNDQERHRAVMRLGFLPPEPAVIDALKTAARSDAQSFVRHYAILSLDRLGHQQAANEIRIEMLASSEEQTVREAAIELGKSGDPRAAKALFALLSRKPPRSVLGFVFEALAGLGDPRTFDAIAPFLSDHEAFIRALAAQALGTLGDPRAVPLLQRSGQDSAHAWNEDRGPSLTVGDIARQALHKLGQTAEQRRWWKVW